MVRVSIILVNYYKYEDTIECIKSIEKSSFKDLEVIIVDNDSKNESVEKINDYLHNSTLNVKLVESKINLGFSGANNLGIENSNPSTKYYFILNNDTVLEKNCINVLYNRMELTDDTVFAVTGKSYYYYQPKVLWWAGTHPYEFIRIPKLINFLNKDNGNKFKKERFIPFITGAYLFCKKELYDGGFKLDNDFFFGVEDYELSYRVRKNKYKMLYVPNAIMWHKVGQTRNFSGRQIFSNYASFILGRKKMAKNEIRAIRSVKHYKFKLLSTLYFRYKIKKNINMSFNVFKKMIIYTFDYMNNKDCIVENDLVKADLYFKELKNGHCKE